MFNPLDPAEMIVAKEGDAAVAPGYPRGGPDGEVPFLDYRSAQGALPPMYRVFDATILSGATQAFDAEDRPDFWMISADNTANQETAFWPLEAPGGVRQRIGPNGHARVLAVGNFFTATAIGAGNSRINVVAVRGFDHADHSWG